MEKIQVLDQITIDKIAAGEVIERPASVVKELVENAIDAGATNITVEIRDGGISFLRVADNGSGIPMDEVRTAFLRHATSKIRSVDDLEDIRSLGFRGEALSSIAAVAQVEVITKTKEDQFGTLYRISGGKEEGEPHQAGAPDGTTFLVRQLFYNTPARRKFLKTPMTEASHVQDLMTRMALSHPEISFQFINNGQSKLHTSGNGQLRDVIYHIYGREVAANLLAVDFSGNGIRITGFAGAPLISRGNRNFETYFVDGRYIQNSIISKAIEDAYRDFTMQHKYPFVVLHLTIDQSQIDVNVHPAKMELRFSNQQAVYNAVYEAVDRALHEQELIPEVSLDMPQPKPASGNLGHTSGSSDGVSHPAQETSGRTAQSNASRQAVPPKEERDLDYFMDQMKQRVTAYHQDPDAPAFPGETGHQQKKTGTVSDREDQVQKDQIREEPQTFETGTKNEIPDLTGNAVQLSLFDEPLLKREDRPDYKLIGQVFDTYWLVEFKDQLYIIDQHAAHERVLYEHTLKNMQTKEYTSQMISPPLILNLSMQEAETLRTYMDQFTRIGFEIEEFGQDSFAVRAVPDNLFSIAKEELLMEMLDDLNDEVNRTMPADLIDEKVASMSCKAAVKGNMKLSFAEADALIGELLTLDNPYHCPHGRPTIIAMSRRELEKKFKRIV